MDAVPLLCPHGVCLKIATGGISEDMIKLQKKTKRRRRGREISNNS